MSKKLWLKHGIWNTLEHLVTRFADAGATLVLLWVLAPEVFAHLAIAQAIVAPFLFFFLAPEAVLYRDFGKWRDEGISALEARVRALRVFSWSKAVLGIAISLLITFSVQSLRDSPWPFLIAPLGPLADAPFQLFSVLIWAFFSVLSPQLSGADREFLRMSLNLRSLNLLTLVQKVTLLGGTILVSLVFIGETSYLAAVAVGSALLTAALGRTLSQKAIAQMKEVGAKTGGARLPRFLTTLRDSLTTFSFWTHISGTLQNWVLTMDVLVLAILKTSERDIGLFASVSKLANFSTVLPLALANLFSVWISQRNLESTDHARERHEVRRWSMAVAGFTLVQGLVFFALGPWILSQLSRERWAVEEQLYMLQWLAWLLFARGLQASTFLTTSFLTLRSSVFKLFTAIGLPHALIAFGVFYGGVHLWQVTGAAIGNVVVWGLYVPLVWFYVGFWRKTREN